MHLIIFSSILTPRIKYIFNFIFKDILKAEVEFTGNVQHFLQSDQVKISYGEQPLADEIFFKSTSILFSNKVDELNIRTTLFGEYQAPFPVQNSPFPFDVFAASFFMISRYEEYLHQKRTNEDFKANKSYQYKWKILERPIIDEWAFLIKNIIRKKHPNFKFHDKLFVNQPSINFTITPNIPSGILNRTKFLFNAVLNKENRYLSTKFDRLTGLGIKNETVLTDLGKTFERRKTNPIFFINFPKVPNDYISVNGVSRVLTNKSVGLLRPCASDKEKINEIKEGLFMLKKILPEQVNLSSQQLEVLKFPICYLNLLNSGITSDYSMGYPEISGFRAGTCTPFNWYDLQLEKVTPLLVKSYCINDSVLQYMGLETINKSVKHYVDSVKFVNGQFLSNWQLRSLSDNLKYKKLKTAFNEMISYAGN
ncbi:hypothetical protein DU508_07620 [Pedobacter chinensis]|uniref:DUF7033 domain-containing protein n=1 Tax=Pedobacter chinensis TaxID=2282421 RepID=A0A369PX22_9SPHI|nr:hypothetical protein [Pedobacter chinensis]RDC57054.1 hypothetical protein DU508_07620 [Pedobacter chinensis]